jgi:hypothetical protein
LWRLRVRIDIDLEAGFPVEEVQSRYHAAVSERLGESRYRVRLRDEEVPADRDFELAWKAQPGAMPRSALFKEEKDGATYALLTLFPPSGPGSEESRLAREVVYVIDTSGSMEGASIQQARKALLLAMDRLHAGERFNVIQFNSITDQLFRRRVPWRRRIKPPREPALPAGLHRRHEMAAVSGRPQQERRSEARSAGRLLTNGVSDRRPLRPHPAAARRHPALHGGIARLATS